MKNCVLLSLLLALGCLHVHGAPVAEEAALTELSCDDAQAKFAAGLALTKLNQNRDEGYILRLHRVSNAHMKTHAETGVVFYLTMDVLETNCSVLSRKDWKTCEARTEDNTPVYGQCKAVFYTNRPHRVTRLYKYSCDIRPVPAARLNAICPDCPTLTSMDGEQVQRAVNLSLEKFNKEGGVNNRFALLKVSRATAGMAMSMNNVEYTIQETTCSKTAETTDCPVMSREFAHKGFCMASLWNSPSGEANVSVECEIFEPEAAVKEKSLHLKAGETDHAHTDAANHNHDHDGAHVDHNFGSDHMHSHPQTHDHEHNHTRMHEHEHPHDHHNHTHKHDIPQHPEGMVRVLPAMDQAMTLPSSSDVPAAGPEVGVSLPSKQDPQIPGVMEPVIEDYPTTVSAQCPPVAVGESLLEKVIAEDPMFKAAA